MNGELLAFALVMVIGQFSPGPDMLLLTRTSLSEGLKAGWTMVTGIVTGLAVHAILAIGGMAVLVAKGGPVAKAMSWVAATYLLWLAFGLLTKPDGEGDVAPTKRSPYFRGLFCNLLNPKVLVFFASVVAPFLSGEHPGWWPLALWFIIVAEGLVFWCLWVWLLQRKRIRQAYQRAGRPLDILFAIALACLAVALIIR